MDAECRKYPRRSAEIWVEDNYDDIYIDPIALLGADTPYSDLGLMYSKQDKEGVERLCYMAAPVATGALNCYTPGSSCCEEKKEKEKYQMDLDGGGQDINQVTQEQMNIAQIVVRAIEQAPWCQFVKRLMEAQAKQQDAARQSEQESASPDAPPQEQQPTQTREPQAEPPQVEQPAQEEEIQAEELPEEDSTNDSSTPYEEGEKSYPTYEDSDDEQIEGIGETKETPTETQSSDVPQKEDKSDVQATPEVADSAPDDGADDYGEEPDEDYSEGGEEDMSEINEQIARIDGLEKQVRNLTAVVRDMMKTGTDKARYSKLESLSRDRVLNVQDEFERCCYDKMSDEQFDEHVRTIEANYRVTPTAIQLPNGLIRNASQDDEQRPGRVLYSKEKAEQIESEVMRRGIANSQAGKYVSADEIRRQVEQEFFGGKE